MLLGLEDKVVVVMGGTSGVGLKTAEMFLEEGAKVSVCGRNPERMAVAYQHLLNQNSSDKIYADTCDVTCEDQVNHFVNRTAENLGGIDILVNAAGKSIMGHFFDITNDQWDEQIRLKYFSVIYAVRAVYPYMLKRGGGRVININATLAKEPEPHMVATAATRAGLLNLSKTLAHELAPDNILVNSVSLGLIRTDQWERRRKRGAQGVEPEVYYSELAKKRKIPLGRVGEPEEVASVIVFLSSEKSSYVSGSTIEVAGGIGKAL
ncbi:NAD(P)-dependent dehydrogenase (short-subunit alcohol dehydrogenase family) [Scopulibacillus darangshiensis]|uniref:NAD(P)-dependent dehydrogenase (Short-subunit alcohol dehydrogenase family) n=1 Tax=Scopulibacillus darangshiensis TaxID=442528 RepID=A0A4R2P9K7_9BACL|nr:SDR family oxidoreductase [Scopulibacillus darangshiensis]TCP31713.1 NAD(P)-dependent dehydrogenase (short-subunit alcohol dehydrogenase family) [Scopulibacillus darangshiensis]